ncbi:ribonuclease H2 subunit C [Spea bombifrons]|uniref:ribonuclease H2 subunit C n=1 Tax=Spea bombifrons TaxID=233779 RepID=UPI00234934A6|nr:ribonuclease H2 subunit C [Spea bombifrons]
MAESSAVSCISVDVRSLRSAAQEPLHLLPCEVQKEGAASVREYFSPAVKDGDGGKEVSFRGRALRGQEVFIPSGFMGIVLKENHRPCTDDEDRSLTVRSTFNSFTQWNLEMPPSADDVLVMSLAWPKIATAMHAPVD